MARMLLLHEHFQRRALRRERLFRDRANPLEVYDDVELYERYRFRRGQLVDLVGLVDAQIKHPTNRNGALTSVQQVCLALRFFSSGCFQNLTGDLIGVHKSTACRAIHRVSRALSQLLETYVSFPTDPAVLLQYKAEFMVLGGFPNVIGCVDCTHVTR